MSELDYIPVAYDPDDFKPDNDPQKPPPHPSFFEQMGRQITKILEKALGVARLGDYYYMCLYNDIKDVIASHPDDYRRMYISIAEASAPTELHGKMYMRLYLIGTTASGFYFVSWRSLKDPGDLIPITREVGPDDIEFEMCDLPPKEFINHSNQSFYSNFVKRYKQAVKRWAKKKAEHVNPFERDYRYEVILGDQPEYPDIVFEFTCDVPVDEKLEAAFASFMDKFMEKWNAKSERYEWGEEIHYNAPLPRDPGDAPNSYQHHVDFGSCDPEHVFGDFGDFLKALDKAENLPVLSVTVGV